MPKRPDSFKQTGAQTTQEQKRETWKLHDKGRESSSQRGYDARWRKIRLKQLQREPICRHCKQHGIITEANTVDHIIPHRGDKELFNDMSNLQSLCKRCHDKKTGRGL